MGYPFSRRAMREAAVQRRTRKYPDAGAAKGAPPASADDAHWERSPTIGPQLQAGDFVRNKATKVKLGAIDSIKGKRVVVGGETYHADILEHDR